MKTVYAISELLFWIVLFPVALLVGLIKGTAWFYATFHKGYWSNVQ